MTAFTRHDLQRITISAIGALLVSTACVGAAIFPAKAAEITTPTAADWQAEVERRLDNAMPSMISSLSKVAVTEVVLRFDAQGNFRSASIDKSSGVANVDQQALRVANRISYPALPTHLQGKPQRVGMQIVFGRDGDAVRRRLEKAQAAATALAAKADANRAEARIVTQPAG